MNYIIKQRKSRTSGYRLLSIRFKFKDGKWDYSLNIKVKEGSYNSKEKIVNGDLESTIRLQSILEVISRVNMKILVEENGIVLKPLFKERFLNVLAEKGFVNSDSIDHTGKSVKYMVDYIEDYVLTRERAHQMRNATGVTYKRLLKKVKEFDSKWDILSTDQAKLKAFRLFIIDQGLATATINLMLTRLRTILKSFDKYESGLSSQIIESPHLGKMKELKKTRVYITKSELDIIYSMDIKDLRLSKARDLFLIGCYTALRVSDWGIKPNDISEDKSRLIYRTQKTGTIVEIPLFDKLRTVLERNNWTTPYIPESQINQLFRKLCKEAQITRSFTTLKVYPDRTDKKIIEAWEGVSSHTCRRSFATNTYLEGLPVSQIRAYTGHASDKVFMNYVQASDTEISQQVKLDTLNKIFNNEK